MTVKTNDLKEKILQGTSKSLRSVGVNRLKEIIHTSEKEKREYGIMFCGDEVPPFGNISHTGLCTGKGCNVDISDCKGRTQIGTFHTHPHIEKAINIGNLSGDDIYQTISHKQSFACLGLIENKPIIKCFIPGLYINPIIALNAFRANEEYDNKLSEVKKQKTKKSVDELISAYDKRIIADGELYRESKSSADKLQKADLIIDSGDRE